MTLEVGCWWRRWCFCCFLWQNKGEEEGSSNYKNIVFICADCLIAALIISSYYSHLPSCQREPCGGRIVKTINLWLNNTVTCFSFSLFWENFSCGMKCALVQGGKKKEVRCSLFMSFLLLGMVSVFNFNLQSPSSSSCELVFEFVLQFDSLLNTMTHQFFFFFLDLILSL